MIKIIFKIIKDGKDFYNNKLTFDSSWSSEELKSKIEDLNMGALVDIKAQFCQFTLSKPAKRVQEFRFVSWLAEIDGHIHVKENEATITLETKGTHEAVIEVARRTFWKKIADIVAESE